ncbi:MAG: ABC transporter substrate-binding protein [Pseudorhodoplanes sp.]|uniref:ABC transporter substrate-binding protein n=1 Tax=Pseudorhodoplanes sp. TaxID=1934341 RepID=UPI003D0EA42D
MLSVAIGNYPHTRLLKERLAGSKNFDFVEVSPITKAFAQMVRQGTYDISEMALVTFLQAKAFGKPLVLIPAAVAARSQEVSLIKLAKNESIRGPADLQGKRIGVRAYSQTTGAWVRGILKESFGIAPEQVHWTTFEDPHVAEYSDPAFATRAKPGSALLDMLRSGDLDAIIVGNDKPADADLADVYPDAEAAGREFTRKHGFVPVNHVLVAKQSVVDAQRDLLLEFWAAVKAAWKDTPSTGSLPIGRAAIEPSVALALNYISAQSMLPRPMTEADIWAGLPAGF